MSGALDVVDLGLTPYADALALQRAAAMARIDGTLANDTLILLEHPPVVTVGRSVPRDQMPVDRAALEARGVELFEVERGGDVTFHGPGQLVAYPIIDLRTHRQDLHWYLRQLEEVLVRALDALGIPAERRASLTGVWTDGRKIASIGVHARQWVTWHGLALNVTTDLGYFDLIVPCGIEGVEMTSVQRELSLRSASAVAADLPAAARAAVVGAFGDVFALAPSPQPAEMLRAFARAPALTATER